MQNRWMIFINCAFVTACVGVSGPKDYDLPPEDRSLDPAALQQPHLIYGCGQWMEGESPSPEKIFVDVAFIRNDPADPQDRPSDRHLAALKKRGGAVAYTFHFPGVRTWIAKADIPELAADKEVESVFRIADLRRYDWNVDVGYGSRAAYNAGLVSFEELGGRVNYRFEGINAIGGLIPDRSVPSLRKSPDTKYVESSVPIPPCKLGSSS